MTGSSFRNKALSELREFSILAVYLWICFGALVFLKAAILQAHGIAYLPLGFAAIKAVVSAKFVLIGRLFGLAKSRRGERLFVAILRRTFALLVLLVILTVVEEVGLAMIHGRAPSEAITSLAGGTVWQMAATVVIMLLILIPYVGFQSLGEVLGRETLLHLLVERTGQSDQGGAHARSGR